MNDERACRHCQHCQMDESGDFGDCRSHPPDTQIEDERIVYYPLLVPADHWCGEFRRRVN